MLYKSNTGSDWSKSEPQKIKTFWLILGPKMLIPKNITVRFGWDSFFSLENVVLIWIAYPKPQIYEINISKSRTIDRHFDKKKIGSTF